MLILLVFIVDNQCMAMDIKSKSLVVNIDKLCAMGRNAPNSLYESISDKIDSNPSEAASLLLSKVKDTKLTEIKLAIYVWALGLTRDSKAVNELITIAKKTKSKLVKDNCLRALATIGGNKAGYFLLFTLDKTKDKEMRFNILNSLSQMQFKPALPKTKEVLKQDPSQYYWHSIFVFGKMGDISVPLLIRSMSSKYRNVRLNAINVLGKWLISPKSAKAMRKQYWKENTDYSCFF